MAILSMKEKLEILRDATLEDDVFFSSCLEGSNDIRSGLMSMRWMGMGICTI